MAVAVKICGVNSEAALAAAVANGASALGFNFYPPSPRAIDAGRARALTAMVPPGIVKIGLFVDAGTRPSPRCWPRPPSTCSSSMATRPRAG